MSQPLFKVVSRPWDAPEWDILHEEPVTQEEGMFIIDVAAGLTIHLEYTLLPVDCTGHWEVLTFTLFDGWVNTWSDDDGKPITFETYAGAHEDLLTYLQAMREAERNGDVLCAPTEADHRIVFVPNKEK